MLGKLRQYGTNMSIRRKLLVISFLLVVLPVLLFGLIITSVYNTITQQRVSQSVTDSSASVGTRIARILADAENCSNYLTININRSLNMRAGDKMTPVQQLAVGNELYSSQIIFDEIDSIVFIDLRGEALLSDNGLVGASVDFDTSPQMEQLRDTSGESIWFPFEKRNFFVRSPDTPSLTLGKKVIQINTGLTLGYLFVNVDLNTVSSVLESQAITYGLTDAAGMAVGTAATTGNLSEEAWVGLEALAAPGDAQTLRWQGGKYCVTSLELGKTGWRLVAAADLNDYRLDGGNLVLLVAITAAATVMLEIWLASYLTKIISTPLLKLKNGAEEIAGGNMALRINFKTEDEIGQLGSAFNNMARQIQELLVKVEQEARKKQEYELALLHEQVKPHFLYNTLDLVVILSEIGRERDSRQAVRRLASYYRNSLSDSKPIITIAQEMQLVDDYLALQRMLHSDVFTYEVQMDKNILSTPIPKLTLQPLVENAISHGLQHRQEPGVLRITGRWEETGVVLAVQDDGVGMSEPMTREIMRNEPQGNFGVYSVNHRIKLYFGEGYGVEVQSEAGRGTTVWVRLPHEFGGEEEL